MRQVVLDTETTGLEVSAGHRVIEIGCVELLDRRLTGSRYHTYLRPDREIDPGAIQVHGISNEFLRDQPGFADIAEPFIDYIRDSELIIHNAPFDIGFLNRELELARGNTSRVEEVCTVLDTLALARHMHPGQRNTLDALCGRYQVDNTGRSVHGALLDAELLALVYLAMTGGQGSLFQDQESFQNRRQEVTVKRFDSQRPALKVIRASTAERLEHDKMLQKIDTIAKGGDFWQKTTPATETDAGAELVLGLGDDQG